MIAHYPTALDAYLAEFGTLPYLKAFLPLLGKFDEQAEVYAANLPCAKDKFGLLLQQFLTKLIQLAICETSLLEPHKRLFVPGSPEDLQF